LTQWDEIYFRLNAAGFQDRRWDSDNFGKQAVKDITAALKWVEKSDISRYNIESISTAKLATVVVGALAGKKSKVTPEDFLPFDTRKLKRKNGLTDESIRVLQGMMRSRRLDGRLLGLLADEIKTASVREQAE